MKPAFQTEKSTPNEERSMHNGSEVEKAWRNLECSRAPAVGASQRVACNEVRELNSQMMSVFLDSEERFGYTSKQNFLKRLLWSLCGK